jgi:hypothetical protein
MKLLYSGGLNKYDPKGYQQSYFYRFSHTLHELIAQQKKIGCVTLAKPDHYYDEHLIPQFGSRVDVIGHEVAGITWEKYDVIFLCGGDTLLLQKSLQEKAFGLSKLKSDAIIFGDSAGAMLLAPFFYVSNEKAPLQFFNGIYSQSGALIIVHANNQRYCNEKLVNSVEEFARSNDLRTLVLKENEVRQFDQKSGQFSKVNFADLF